MTGFGHLTAHHRGDLGSQQFDGLGHFVKGHTSDVDLPDEALVSKQFVLEEQFVDDLLRCAGSLVHPFRKKAFEKRETKEKRGVNVKREQAWFLGKDAVLRCASVPGLVCEGLDTEPAWE